MVDKNNKPACKSKKILLAALISSVLSPGLLAQAIEEVTVTAQKIEQNIQEVPVSVSVLSGAQLTERGITDVFDLQQSAPGLTVQQNQTATTSNFSIRGVGTSGSNFGLESSVGLYVDGVYRARQSSMINEMVDMDRVEVLRGPQGTLFGRNGPSGAVLMHTRAPDHETSGFVEATAGNFDLLSVNGAIGGSLIEDILAYRVTAFGTTRDGYIDDLFFGDEVLNDRDRQGFRAQLLYTPNDDFSARIIVDHASIDEHCCAAVTVRNNYAIFPRNSFTGQFATTPSAGTDALLSIPSVFSIPGLPVPIYGFGATIIDQSQVFDDVVAYNLVPESENEDQGISAHLNWQMGGGELRSITSFRNFDSDDRVDADFSNAGIATRDEHAEQSSFSQEFNFSKTFENGNFLLGAYYFQQDLDTVSNTVMSDQINSFIALSVFAEASGLADQAAVAAGAGDFATAQLLATQAQYTAETATAIVVGLENVPLSPDNPIQGLQNLGFTGIGFPSGGFAQNTMKQEHKAWAIFGQFDYDLTEKLRLTMGARYTNETKDLDGQFTEQGFSWGAQLGLDSLTVFNPRADIDETLDDEQITGNIKLSWFPSENIMFYSSFATGYKSGGTNTDRIHPAFSPIFDAETSESFELGMKADFPEQNLRVNLTLHHTTTEDYQTNSFQGNGFNLSNAGEVKTQGGELEFWWNPTDSLNISGAYVYNEGEFEGFSRANCWIAFSALTGQPDPGRANPTDGFCDRSGDPLDSNAENTYILSATQSFQLSDNISGFVHANYNYRSKQYKDGNIDPLKVEDGYGLLNARAGINFDEFGVEISAWARNLLDEDYLATYFDTPLQEGKLSAYPTEPRTYGLTVSKHF